MSEMNELSNLPVNLNIMHESQEKWRTKAWQKTLAKHGDELEKTIERINLFDIWSNNLQNVEAAKKLIPEIFMDGYISVHFSGYGLYKYANACLRSQLETTLRLIYFSTHTIEFGWWQSGNEWYRNGLRQRDVWGDGYQYFQELVHVKDFEQKCNQGERLFRDGGKVSRVYSKLSTYVHSGIFSFQTKPDEFSPQYKIEPFKLWLGNFSEVQEYIHILLILNFMDEFRQMHAKERETILQVAIRPDYKTKLQEMLGS